MNAPDTLDLELARAAEALGGAARVAVFTGAGMSKESGLPTFREAQTGTWAQYNPEEIASEMGYLRDPVRVWDWYAHRRGMYGAVEPNAGHRAIAALDALYEGVTVVTQNIDDLHRRAGSRDVVELHGNIYRFKCFDGGHAVDPEAALRSEEKPPRCPQCGGGVRPDVVWFGEALPAAAWRRGEAATVGCHAMLVVGTSGVVYPAAGLPYLAAQAGATVIEINPEPAYGPWPAGIVLAGPAAEILPALVGRLAG